MNNMKSHEYSTEVNETAHDSIKIDQYCSSTTENNTTSKTESKREDRTLVCFNKHNYKIE